MNYYDFKVKREENQDEVAKLFENIKDDNILVVESPTGSGKTFTDLKSAIKYREKHSKSIIITTNNNSNALEIKSKFIENHKFLNLNKDELCVEIGKRNYIDLERLVETLEKFKILPDLPMLNKEIIHKYYNKESLLKNDVLIDDFAKKFELNSMQSDILQNYAQDIDISINPKELKNIEDKILSNKIIVMNHSYLLILYRYYGNSRNRTFSDDFKEKFFSTPIIFDEFHTLFDSAKTIFSSSFSLFRLKYSIDGIIKNLNEEEHQGIIKSLKQFLSYIITCQNRISTCNEKIDDVEKFKIIDYLSILKNELSNKKISSLKNRLSKTETDMITNETELNKYIRFLKQELSELQTINLKSKKMINLSLSPKGYPRVSIDNGFPSYKLRDVLWNRLSAPSLCLSGTLRSTLSTKDESYSWVIKRNGLFKKDMQIYKDYLLNTGYEKDDIIDLLANNYILNKKIDNIQYKSYASLFKKNRFIFSIINNKGFEIPYGSLERSLRDEKITIWRSNIGKFIGSNSNHNSLVLTTSYDDAKYIGKTIQKDRPDIKVFYATEGEAMSSTVTKFKESIKKGNICCLVGTEQYYTGLDLKGDLLLELYFTKIPFEPPKGQIGSSIFPELGFTKDENYFNKTYFKFMQGVGRGIRDYEDRAIMYILDTRINSGKRVLFRDFLDTKGFNVSYLDMHNKHKPSILKDKPKSNISTSIYMLFFDYLIDKSINDIYEIFKIDYNEIDNINIAVEKILLENITIEQIYTKDEFIKLIETQSYQNIWNLLLKIYTKGLEKKGQNLEKEILNNNMYGFNNITDLSKYIFLTKN